MTRRQLIGKVLQATKNVQFSAPHPGALSHKFFAGRPPLPYGLPIEWWVTPLGNAAAEDLAHSVRALEPALAKSDESRLATLVFEVLGSLIVRPRVFDFANIISGKYPTLFDAITGNDKIAAGGIIYDAWVRASKAEVKNWLVISPLQNTECVSFSVSTGLSLINASDVARWSRYQQRFPAARAFDFGVGMSDSRLSVFERGVSTHEFTWVVTEEHGSEKQARQNSAVRAKTFVAVAISFASVKSPAMLLRMGWRPTDRSFQFEESGGWASGSSGQLMPPTGEKLVFSHTIITAIVAWYERLNRAHPDKHERLMQASLCLHNAIMQGNDTARFLQYFLGIDALFGERHAVRSSIVKGVNLLTHTDPTWNSKITPLFRLRSAIAHGKVTDIAQWPGYRSYRQLFRSEPLRDIEELALRAVREFSP